MLDSRVGIGMGLGMFIATIVVSVMVALFVTQSAIMKFQHAEQAIKQIVEATGVPLSWLPWLGATEIAGGVGLLVGLAYWPLGVAAGIGLVLYFIGAVGAHLRNHDRHIQPAMILLLLSGLALGLRIASH